MSKHEAAELLSLNLADVNRETEDLSPEAGLEFAEGPDPADYETEEDWIMAHPEPERTRLAMEKVWGV